MLGPKKTAAADYIEESYPLSPMQQGMFFHGLSAPHSGVDIEQIICTLPEEIHFAAFREAWDRASRSAGLQKIVDYVKQNGYANATVTGKDSIDFGDGNGAVDVLTGDGTWWWGPKN